MKARRIDAAWAAGLMMAVLGCAAPASAQSALDGPLAAPDAVPATHPKPATHAKAKPHKAHHAAAKASKAAAANPQPTPVEAPAHAQAPTNAIDLGMKWQGSSDGSAQTKYQSGPDTSAGSGAEVGMKLHF